MATGLAIMGFGGGALIASPLVEQAARHVRRPARGRDRSARSSRSACIYFVVMMLGAFAVRRPRRGLEARRAGRREAQARAPMITTRERHRRERDPDAAVLAAVGRAVLQRHRRHRHPRAGLADDPGLLRQRSRAAAAAGFVGLLSLCNMSGRFVWSSTSDADRAQADVHGATSGSARSCYFLLATDGHRVGGVCSCCSPASSCRFYGGGFATVPAYLKDLFGTIEVGAIHGRLLTAWSAAGIAGPLIVNGARRPRDERRQVRRRPLHALAATSWSACSSSASSPTC